MNFLLSQIILCMFVSGLIGTLIGWFLRTKTADRKSQSRIQVLEYERAEFKKGMHEVDHKWKHKYHGLQIETDEIMLLLNEIRSEKNKLNRKVKTLESQLNRRISDNEILAKSFMGLQEDRQNTKNQKIALEEQLLELEQKLETVNPGSDESASDTSETTLAMQFKIDELNESMASLDEKLQSAETINEELESKIRNFEADQVLLNHQTTDLEKEKHELSLQLKHTEETMMELQESKQSLLAEHESLMTQNDHLSTELNMLTQERDGLLIDKVDLEHMQAQALKDPTAPTPDHKNATLSPNSSLKDRLTVLYPNDAGPPTDDLTQIKGIGRITEKLLKSLGVHFYKQIAEFTREEEIKYGEALGSFNDRIQRENWIDQAKKLHQDKYGASS